jgi:hypothetical protein
MAWCQAAWWIRGGFGGRFFGEINGCFAARTTDGSLGLIVGFLAEVKGIWLERGGFGEHRSSGFEGWRWVVG